MGVKELITKANRKKGRFKKILQGIVTFIGISGIIAIINFYLDYKERQQKEYDSILKDWKVKIDQWKIWSPEELATGTVTFNANGLDLDTGSMNSHYNRSDMDLYFSGGDTGFNSYFRALNGASWVDKGLRSSSNIYYRDLESASYSSPKNLRSGYRDLFFDHPSNSPVKGYTYFIKTSCGNFAIVQINGYLTQTIPGPGRHFFRKMIIWFKTYPNKSYPPKPKRPSPP